MNRDMSEDTSAEPRDCGGPGYLSCEGDWENVTGSRTSTPEKGAGKLQVPISTEHVRNDGLDSCREVSQCSELVSEAEEERKITTGNCEDAVNHVEAEAGTTTAMSQQLPSSEKADLDSRHVDATEVRTIPGGISNGGHQQTPEVGSLTANLPPDSSSKQQDDEMAKVAFERGLKCVDVSDAMKILKTSYSLSDVTIRKYIMTWSCWNIADMVQGPHRETGWWKGRMDTEPEQIKEIISEDNDEEMFHQKLEALCRRIDARDQEIVQLLESILQVARRNTEIAGEDPLEVTATRSEPVEVVANAAPVIKRGDGLNEPSMPTELIGADSARAPAKDGSAFTRMLQALRKRFTRRRHRSTNY